MATEVPGYVTKTDLVAALIRELLIPGELRRTPPPLGYISTSWARIR
jgi:hypothetical protein